MDRGYFVDVKTLAAALLSESHSLDSLSKLLKIPHPKLRGGTAWRALSLLITSRYALRDTQATWECFDILATEIQRLWGSPTRDFMTSIPKQAWVKPT